MDGLRDKVIAIATTSKPDEIDAQLKRGGRFDLELKMEAPNIEGER
jgi:ATP-dependent Zn protease